jgi:hypothetical protein
MIEDDFYASIKLTSGEEIFAKVAACEEDDRTLLLVSNPVTISEIKGPTGYAYKVEPWLKTSDEDMFIIDIKNVITMSESSDLQMISMYQSFIKKNNSNNSNKNNNKNLGREMGYICDINDAKVTLENIFKNS